MSSSSAEWPILLQTNTKPLERPHRHVILTGFADCPTRTFLEAMLGRMLRQRAIKSRRRHRIASKKPDQGWSPGGQETFMSALFPTVDGRLQSAAPKPYQARMLAEQQGRRLRLLGR